MSCPGGSNHDLPEANEDFQHVTAAWYQRGREMQFQGGWFRNSYLSSCLNGVGQVFNELTTSIVSLLSLGDPAKMSTICQRVSKTMDVQGDHPWGIVKIRMRTYDICWQIFHYKNNVFFLVSQLHWMWEGLEGPWRFVETAEGWKHDKKAERNPCTSPSRWRRLKL